MIGEISSQEKYGEMSVTPPHFLGYVFTCDFSFTKFKRAKFFDFIVVRYFIQLVQAVTNIICLAG